jgi:hypothetical protein
MQDSTWREKLKASGTPLFLFAPSSFALHSHTAGAVLHLEPIGRAAELEPKGGGKVARIRRLTARETR